MKRAISLVVVACALLLGSCTKGEPYTLSSLTLSELSVVFPAEGGERIVGVTPFPANEEWNIVGGKEDWVTLDYAEGGVSVVVEPNYTTTHRSSQFSLTSPRDKFDTYVVTVSQEAATELSFATSASDSYSFDSEGGTYTFVVACNGTWSVSSSEDWLSVEKGKDGLVSISAGVNDLVVDLEATIVITAGEGEQQQSKEIAVTQGTRENNPYLQLVGKWEVTANKWFYSTNGSLNTLDYAPAPADYYLIFSIDKGEYGKTLIMRDFLYPGTELEVRYDPATQGIVIPFGWTVLSYDVFFYITVVGSNKFSYASLEVEATPSADHSFLSLDMPTVSGYTYVGFGLWTFNDRGDKVAVGSNYRPTMFPMAPISFRKVIEQ